MRIEPNLRFSGFLAYHRFQIGCVFFFYTILHIYEFSWKFDTVLYQFLDLYVRFSGLFLYSFYFSFTVPLNSNIWHFSLKGIIHCITFWVDPLVYSFHDEIYWKWIFISVDNRDTISIHLQVGWTQWFLW